MRTKRIQTLLTLAFVGFVPGAEGQTMKPWIDANEIHGKLLCSIVMRASNTMAAWGHVTDQDGDPVTMTLLDQDVGATLTTNPNDPNGPWQVVWTPDPNELGVHYLYLMALEDGSSLGGKRLSDHGTIAINVVPPNRPPEIILDGIKIE